MFPNWLTIQTMVQVRKQDIPRTGWVSGFSEGNDPIMVQYIAGDYDNVNLSEIARYKQGGSWIDNSDFIKEE